MKTPELLCDRIIHTGFVLLAVIVPLILTPINYELFEYNKMMLTYGITAVILGAWLGKMIAQKRLLIARTPFDLPIGLFVLSQFLSTLFSMDRHVSWFGYYSRFNGGMLSVIAYTLLFYAFVANIKKEFLPQLAKFLLGTALVVASYGIAEHFGIDKHIWIQDVQSRVFSTLGQPNWLAAYLVALIPLTFIISPSVFSFIVSILFFVTLLFTRSRSGLLAFAIIDVLFWAVLFIKSRRAVKIQGLALNLLFAVCIFIFGTGIPRIDNFFKKTQSTPHIAEQSVGPVLESGGTESGVIRKYVWQAALNAWKSSPKHMALGTGTETFAFAFYKYKPVGHNLTSEWDFLYNKAHNEYLNFLATTGILGLGSYLLLIGSIGYWFMKNSIFNLQFSKKFRISNFIRQLADQIEQSNTIVIIGLFCGWLSLLITNFFGFSVVVTQLLFFLLPGTAYVYNATNFKFQSPKWGIKLTEKNQYVCFTISLCLTTAICILIVLAWFADTKFAKGYRFSRAGKYANAYAPLARAVGMNPFEPIYRDEYGSILSSLSLAAAESEDATLAATLAASAIRENDRAIAISPENVTFWKTKTKILYALSSIDEQYLPRAVQALERARLLSPHDPKIVYNLAILAGKNGEYQNAIELLLSAKELKPNYKDAYYALYIFYKETKEPNEAKKIIQEYMTSIDSQDEEFQQLLQ